MKQQRGGAGGVISAGPSLPPRADRTRANQHGVVARVVSVDMPRQERIRLDPPPHSLEQPLLDLTCEVPVRPAGARVLSDATHDSMQRRRARQARPERFRRHQSGADAMDAEETAEAKVKVDV